MGYFTTKCSLFLVPSNICNEEFKKIDIFLKILDNSGVGSILEKEFLNDKKSLSGRKEYDIFQLFAVVVYCFSKFKEQKYKY